MIKLITVDVRSLALRIDLLALRRGGCFCFSSCPLTLTDRKPILLAVEVILAVADLDKVIAVLHVALRFVVARLGCSGRVILKFLFLPILSLLVLPVFLVGVLFAIVLGCAVCLYLQARALPLTSDCFHTVPPDVVLKALTDQ